MPKDIWVFNVYFWDVFLDGLYVTRKYFSDTMTEKEVYDDFIKHGYNERIKLHGPY